jgi:ubiquinone/menaquinone biosynthesis C-methylase UbiE
MQPAGSDHYQKTQSVFQYTAQHLGGFYDSIRGGPGRHTWVQRRVRRMTIAEIGAAQPMGSVLDAGCGRGDFTLEMAEAFPALEQLVGVDFATDALQIAEEEAASDPRLSFAEGHLNALPQGDNSIDCVVCVNVLHHVLPGDQSDALRELARVAKRTVIVEIKNAANPYYGRRTYRNFPPVGRIEVFPTTGEKVVRALGAPGFQLAHVSGLLGFRRVSPILVLRFTRR